MIYVIDNGGTYSDYRMHFVETRLSLDDMKLLVGYREYNEEARVIAVAEKIGWLEGGPMSLAGYCPMAVPSYTRTSAAPWVYIGAEAVDLRRVRFESRQEVPAAVWRRVFEEIDSTDGWAKGWNKSLDMPRQYPEQARAAALAALEKLESQGG